MCGSTAVDFGLPDIGSMQFPISRDNLLKYRTDQLLKKEIDNRVDRLVAAICSGVEETVMTSDRHRYTFDATQHLIFHTTRVPWREAPATQEMVISKTLDELKKRFVDCVVILDSLMKTITVSWEKQGPGDWHG